MKIDSRLKAFNVRLPYNVWKFLKMTAAEQERSMTDVIIECVDKYKKKLQSRLTDSDAKV